MICPHCQKETPATLPYCQGCGLSMDLTFDKVKESFVEEAETISVRRTEETCRFWLFTAATAFAVALAARLLLVPHVEPAAAFPAYVVEEAAESAALPPFEPLPLEPPALDIPK